MIAVLNTTSATACPVAPMERPRNRVPSANARIAGTVIGSSAEGLEEEGLVIIEAFRARIVAATRLATTLESAGRRHEKREFAVVVHVAGVSARCTHEFPCLKLRDCTRNLRCEIYKLFAETVNVYDELGYFVKSRIVANMPCSPYTQYVYLKSCQGQPAAMPAG